MADASKSAVAGGDLGLQHARDRVTQPQICMTDDAAAQPRRAVLPAGAHRRCPVDKLGFADRLHLDRAIGAVHRAALDKNGLGDVVTAAGVGEQLLDQKTVPGAVPQMVVGIDDLQPRFDDLLLPQCEPGGIRVTRAGWRIDCRARISGCCGLGACPAG